VALALDHPEAVRGLVLLSGYYQTTVRVDVPLVAPPAIPVIGDVLRHTVSPLLGGALLPLNLKAMFSPLPVPEAFRRDFPYGFPVRPGQIRAESQDAVTMVPAVAAMQERYRDLRLPVTIMAGTHDRIVDVDSHAVWFHGAVPGSELRLVPGAGHMFHHAVPGQVAEAIAALADGQAAGRPDSMSTQPAVELGHQPAA
jgi:pimeloyl-ACP methyl ester carboxylesterase